MQDSTPDSTAATPVGALVRMQGDTDQRQAGVP